MTLSHICPANLTIQQTKGYSKKAQKDIFFGQNVNPVLDFDIDVPTQFFTKIFPKNISLSGFQPKYALVLDKNTLRLKLPHEQGQYILKPIPPRPSLLNLADLPANEHLTTQIASQIFGINTAKNAIVFMKNNDLAYLTKRFDYDAQGNKIAQEDFAVLAGKSREINGENFKYEGSCELLGQLLKKYVRAYQVEVEKLFSLIIFNYLFANGDAHLKNFSLQQTLFGDYVLSPAYDLLNTALHLPNDTFVALNDGFFENDFYTPSFEALGFYAYNDFLELSKKFEISEKRFQKIMSFFSKEHSFIDTLIQNSFLQPNTKILYKNIYLDRIRAINTKFS